MTSYNKVFNSFSKHITDIRMIDFTDQDMFNMARELMESAIPKFMMCKSDLSDRDDELAQFNVDLLPIEIDILGIMMASEWLEPQINSTDFTLQFFGSKDEKWFAPSGLLDKLKERQHELEIKAPKLMNEYNIRSFVKEKMS